MYSYSALFVVPHTQGAQACITQFYLQLHHASLYLISVHQIAPPQTEIAVLRTPNCSEKITARRAKIDSLNVECYYVCDSGVIWHSWGSHQNQVWRLHGNRSSVMKDSASELWDALQPSLEQTITYSILALVNKTRIRCNYNTVANIETVTKKVNSFLNC